MESLKDNAAFECKGTDKGSYWVGSVGLLCAILAGCLWVNDTQVDYPMVHNKWLYVVVILLGIGLMYLNTQWRHVVVRFTPLSVSEQSKKPTLKVKVTGRKGLEGEILPESLQYWYWVEGRTRDGDHLRTWNCIALLETTDQRKVGFTHQSLEERSIPNHWKRIDQVAPKGVPLFSVPDIVLLVDFLGGYAK